MIEVLLMILGLLVVFAAAFVLTLVCIGGAMRIVGQRRLDERADEYDPREYDAHAQDTFLMIRTEGEGISFNERLAYQAQLGEIVNLPTADVPALSDWEER
jgi:hypothetical protein